VLECLRATPETVFSLRARDVEVVSHDLVLVSCCGSEEVGGEGTDFVLVEETREGLLWRTRVFDSQRDAKAVLNDEAAA
jgi:hypothetical protein